MSDVSYRKATVEDFPGILSLIRNSFDGVLREHGFFDSSPFASPKLPAVPQQGFPWFEMAMGGQRRILGRRSRREVGGNHVELGSRIAMVSRPLVRLPSTSRSQHRTEPHGESNETRQGPCNHEPGPGDLRLQPRFNLIVCPSRNLSPRTTLLDGRPKPAGED